MKKLIITMFIVVIGFSFDAGAVGRDSNYEMERKQMVDKQIKARGVRDERVLEALYKVERHLFVPDRIKGDAYRDRPLPIGHGQTISQPYIVAYMTEAAEVKPGDRVLEIGTGSGYQAAVLAEIAGEVYTIERIKPLAELSAKRLKDMGYGNVKVKWGDGYKGWEEFAPYDVIIVTAAPPDMPGELQSQLKEGGRMIVPVGRFYQELVLVTRTDSGFERKRLLPVRFVPMLKGEKG